MVVNARQVLTPDSREALPLPVTAAILCGGKSSRMGRPKAFLPYEGKTMVEHRFAALKNLFAEIVIVANEPESYAQLSAEVVKDIIPERGPLVGILSALLVAQHDHVFVIACDMPLIDNKLIREMCMQRAGKDVLVLSHEGGVEPLLGVYSKSCVEPLEQAIFAEKFKVQDFLDLIKAHHFKFDAARYATGGALPQYFNVNTPQDYSRLITE